MRKLLYIFLSTFLFCGCLVAQTDCPKISISGPSGIPTPGESISFTSQVDTGARNLKIEYVWSVSAGEIISGQGTITINVKAPVGSLTTTVEIKGLPEGCTSIFSETVQWCGLVPKAELIESFRGPITAKDKARFDKIDGAMRDDADARYIFFVAGNNLRQLRANKQMIMKYLYAPHETRITFVDLPANSEVTQFWRVPAGADLPALSKDGRTIKP